MLIFSPKAPRLLENEIPLENVTLQPSHKSLGLSLISEKFEKLFWHHKRSKSTGNNISVHLLTYIKRLKT